MNSRVRALVWEEIRVGGSIMAVCLIGGVLLLLRLRFISSASTPPQDLLSISVFVTLGVPLFCALLLILSVRNSGHLGVGFSRRILRLPVGVTAAVTVPLSIRLAEIAALSLSLLVACRLLYHEGPDWRAVFVLAGVYLLVQVLDWTRAVAAWLVMALGLAVAALLIQYTGNWVLLPDFVAGIGRTSTPLFLAGFGCVAGLAYAASLAVVGWTRRGMRIDPATGATLAELLGWRGTYGEGVFSSPQAAQFWFEMRRTRLLLPKAAFLFWLLGTAGYWVHTLIEHYGLAETRPTTAQVFSNPIVTELFPLLALLLAAVVWRMQTSWIGWRESRQSVSGWTARHPVTKAQVARARIAVAGVNLAVTLGAAAALYIATFLLCDKATVLRLLGDAWAIGATSPREVAVLLFGPVLLAGLLAWIVMQFPTAVMILAATVPLVAVCYDFVARDISFRLGMAYYNSLFMLNSEYLWALVLSFPVILFLADLALVLRLGWVRLRSVLLCLAAWTGLALALYPFALHLSRTEVHVAAGYCLCVAALAVTCWPGTVLRQGGGLRTALRPEDAAQHRRTAATVPWGSRVLLAMLVLAMAGSVAWLRWPAEPATRAMLRSQGLPADLTELNAWYKEVPREENLAVKYREAKSAEGPLVFAWNKSQGTASPGLLRSDSVAMANVLVQGSAKVSRMEVIPQEVWVRTKSYWDMVGRPVAEKLHATARSGLSKSRYPTDLREGPGTLLEHLAPLRNLARMLVIEGWVAAVERRPHDAATAVLDTFPIANSLTEEPIFISQLVRIAIQDMAMENLETVLNRCVLPEEELARVQTGLAAVLPPLGEAPLLDRCLTAAECFSLALTENPVLLWDYAEVSSAVLLRYSEGRVVMEVAMELTGIGCLDRAVIALHYRNMRDIGKNAVKNGVLPEWDTVGPWNTGRLAMHAPVASTTLPTTGRTFESEWRIHTRLDLARTALAVERYRLANGRLPERLEVLVPVFLDRAPVDPWNGGKPLSYRVKANGEFEVYSLGHNKTDEKGKEMQNWWTQGDMTFTVAPPEVRERPQVAEAGAGGT